MIVGIEAIGHGPGGLGALAPSAVKLRHPEALAPVLAACPGLTVLLTRPPTEGYSRDQIVDGYRVWADAVAASGWHGRWLHEVANEPNHTAGPWRDDPAGWEREAEMALQGVGASGARILLPGLQPYWRTAEWAALYERLQHRYPGLGRAAHCYWQGAGQIGAGIDDALRQVSRRPAGAWVTEYNDSGHDDEATRVANCLQATAGLRAAGFEGAILFCHEAWRDADGVEFAFSVAGQAAILAAGEVPPIAGGSGMYEIGEGIRLAMAARGDEPVSHEWYPRDNHGREVGVALAFGRLGIYVYAPAVGVRFTPFV